MSAGAHSPLWWLRAAGNFLLHLAVSPCIPFFSELQGCGHCPKRIPPLAQRIPDKPRARFPVDLVYTWVDGADAAHAVLREQYLALHRAERGELHQDATGVAHTRNNDELRYALRSVERFLPWVRRIFLVTAGQTPSWLRADHPRIQRVDHREFIPARYLPTFSSRPIEAWLHRIPGLSEHYIYCNDDFFFARGCAKEEFFTANGLPLLFVDWRASRLDGYRATGTPHAASYGNVVRFLEKKGYTLPYPVLTAHCAYPQSKTDAEAAFAFYAEAIAEFSGDRFRTNRGMAFYSHAIPLLSFMRKRAVPCDVPSYYINTKRVFRRMFYRSLLAGGHERGMPPFFCLNDVGDAPQGHTWERDMRQFLEAFFPEPSSFENPDVVVP